MEMPSFGDYQKMMQNWFEMASKMAWPGMMGSTETPMDAARQMRDMYSQTMGKMTDQFMRSPQFQEMSRQSMDATVAMRQQANDALNQAHQAMGNVSRQDVDSLLMAVRRSETRILDKLDELSTRLDELEEGMRVMKPSNGKVAHKSR